MAIVARNDDHARISITNSPRGESSSATADACASLDFAGAVDAIVDAGGGRNELRLWRLLDAQADAGGVVSLTHADVHRALGFSPSTTLRTYRRCVQAGVLERHEDFIARTAAGPGAARIAPGYDTLQTANLYIVRRRRPRADAPRLVKSDDPVVRTVSTQEQEQPPARTRAPVVPMPKAITVAEKIAEPKTPAPLGARLRAFVRREAAALPGVTYADLDAAEAAIRPKLLAIAAKDYPWDGDPLEAMDAVFDDLREQLDRRHQPELPSLLRRVRPRRRVAQTRKAEGPLDPRQRELFASPAGDALLTAIDDARLARYPHLSPWRPAPSDRAKAATRVLWGAARGLAVGELMPGFKAGLAKTWDVDPAGEYPYAVLDANAWWLVPNALDDYAARNFGRAFVPPELQPTEAELEAAQRALEVECAARVAAIKAREAEALAAPSPDVAAPAPLESPEDVAARERAAADSAARGLAACRDALRASAGRASTAHG